MKKYAAIKQALLDRIAHGAYGESARIPPEKALAEEFRVAHMTVRRALQDLVDRGILVRRPGRGHGTFVRGEPASAPRRADAGRPIQKIGLVHDPEWRNMRRAPVFFRLLLEVQGELAREGVSLEFLPKLPEKVTASGVLDLLARSRCEAMLVVTWTGDAGILSAVQAAGVPVVAIGPFLDLMPISSVSPNDYQGAFLATEHLLTLGHEKVAFVGYGRPYKTTTDRLAGWAAAMKHPSFKAAEEWTYWGESREPKEVAAGLAAEFRRRPPPSAILARDGWTAAAVLGALKAIGLSCPADVSVACVGRFFEGAVDMPRMTAAETEEGAVGKAVLWLIRQQAADPGAGPIALGVAMRVTVGETTRPVSPSVRPLTSGRRRRG